MRCAEDSLKGHPSGGRGSVVSNVDPHHVAEALHDGVYGGRLAAAWEAVDTNLDLGQRAPTGVGRRANEAAARLVRMLVAAARRALRVLSTRRRSAVGAAHGEMRRVGRHGAGVMAARWPASTRRRLSTLGSVLWFGGTVVRGRGRGMRVREMRAVRVVVGERGVVGEMRAELGSGVEVKSETVGLVELDGLKPSSPATAVTVTVNGR